jgi:hypothetical protein
VRSNGQKLGFIRAELAAHLAPYMDRGTILTATVCDLTGGDPGETHGVNILISEVEVARADVPSWLRDESAPLSDGEADLSFLDGQAEEIESRYVRRANRSLFAEIVVSIRGWSKTNSATVAHLRTSYSSDATREIRAFFKRTGKVIVPLTVREILGEQIAMKLA